MREKLFVREVWDYYNRHGRHCLPWRLTKNPYRIFVSELMLQQTQVERVIPKYKSFLKCFPTLPKLAKASLREVLKEWQGLGYNRRAKAIHDCAKIIIQKHKGKIPRTYEELVDLPGIGKYTAGAVMAFSYNKPVPIIETNIRTVFIHNFFKGRSDISDSEIFQLTGIVLDTENPREWYYALMDYGAHLKQVEGNLNNQSKHYVKQSTFENSDRQIRGAIVRMLIDGERTRKGLQEVLSFDSQRIDEQIERLVADGIVVCPRNVCKLP
ncbi:MAG: A/G-specific adenine glycosylase [Candidatus Pacebacteria bacterium]|nr:A/G-specific adenine glycosylase [Candidatus Paceibacterota bacterium]MCF7857530.1 A/G-specific adenine glycosylase [Candidatus Paceibacterota bacterium]